MELTSLLVVEGTTTSEKKRAIAHKTRSALGKVRGLLFENGVVVLRYADFSLLLSWRGNEKDDEPCMSCSCMGMTGNKDDNDDRIAIDDNRENCN